MLSATGGTLAAVHARGADTRTPGRPLSTRRAAHPRGLFSLRRHRQCRRGHAPFVRYLLPCRVHDAHRRAVPVVMDGNARALITLEGHPGLVQMRVLTRGGRGFCDGRSLHRDSVPHDDIALRHRSRFFRQASFLGLTRRNPGRAPNDRDLGGDDARREGLGAHGTSWVGSAACSDERARHRPDILAPPVPHRFDTRQASWPP